MKTLTQPEKATEGQKKLITRMIGDVADCDPVQEALNALSKKGAERLKGNPEFAASLRQFAVGQVAQLGVVDEFANEEVESKYAYLSGYDKPTDINAQCNKLRELFSGIGFANQDLQTRIENGEIRLPKHAEGWFAIPNWKKNPSIFGSTYSSAVQTVLNAINKDRKGKFVNYRDGAIDEKHLRQSARSEKFWDELAKAQGDADILIIAAQFGIRHRGRSVRRASVIMEDTLGEIGLGSFAVGIMLLTNPIRLQNVDDLWIDCAGDEFSPGGDSGVSESPCFRFGVGGVEFDAECVDGACAYYGSASGFPPQ